MYFRNKNEIATIIYFNTFDLKLENINIEILDKPLKHGDIIYTNNYIFIFNQESSNLEYLICNEFSNINDYDKCLSYCYKGCKEISKKISQYIEDPINFYWSLNELELLYVICLDFNKHNDIINKYLYVSDIIDKNNKNNLVYIFKKNMNKNNINLYFFLSNEYSYIRKNNIPIDYIYSIKDCYYIELNKDII